MSEQETPPQPSAAGERGLGAFLIPNCGACIPGFKAQFGPGVDDAIATLKAVGESDPTGENEWDTQCYECWADPVVCGCGYLCPCALIPRNMEAIDGQSCEGHLCSAIVMCCLAPCYVASRRTMMRDRYQLKGSKMEDCLLTCFCAACSTCQIARELRLRDEAYAAWYENPEKKPLME